MEHCGDDFLASLAETMRDSEDWDDLQAVESEACGALNSMLEKRVVDDNEDNNNNNENGRNYIDIIDDSPEPKKQTPLMELDSSSDSEDLDFTILKQKGHRINFSSCPEGKGPFLTPVKQSSKSLVRNFYFHRCQL